MKVLPFNKFGNHRHRGYASKREADLGASLHALEQAGVISQLKEQVRYVLAPTQYGKLRTERPITYVSDFTYIDKDGALHVLDAKGFRTKEYVMKRKLMKLILDIEIEEI